MEEKGDGRALVIAVAVASVLIHGIGLGVMANAAAGGGTYRLLYFFKRMGLGHFPLLVLGVIGLASLLFFGLWLTRPGRGRTWTLLVLPALTVIAGVLFERRGVGRAYAAVTGDLTDANQSARIFADGMGEFANNTTFALIVASVLMSGAAAVLYARAAQRGPRRFGAPAKGALVAGTCGLVALAVATSIMGAFQGTALVWLPAVVGVLGVALAASSFDGEVEQQAHSAGDLLAGVACSLGAVALGCQAVWSAGLARALIGSGEEVFLPVERAGVIAKGLGWASAAWGADLAFALPVLLALGGAAVSALPGMRRGLVTGRALALGAVLTSAGLVLAAVLPRRANLETLAGFASRTFPSDLARPIIAGGRPERAPPGPVLYVGKQRLQSRALGAAVKDIGPVEVLDGKRCTEPFSKGHRRSWYRSVYLDASTRYRRMYCVALALAEQSGEGGHSQRPPQFGIAAGLIDRDEREVEWLATKSATNLPAPFGILASVDVAVRIDPSTAAMDRRPNHVHLARDAWQLRQGESVTKIQGSATERLQALRKRLRSDASLDISAEADVPVADVLQVAALTSDSPARLALFGTTKELLAPVPPPRTPSPDQGVDDFMGAHLVGAANGPTIDLENASVTGGLPAEVAFRMVRMWGGRYLQCYKEALKRAPQLSGRFDVAFKVDTEGAVSGAHVENDHLHDARLAECVLAAFHRVSFPAPPEGTATVSIPLAFSTGEP